MLHYNPPDNPGASSKGASAKRFAARQAPTVEPRLRYCCAIRQTKGHARCSKPKPGLSIQMRMLARYCKTVGFALCIGALSPNTAAQSTPMPPETPSEVPPAMSQAMSQAMSPGTSPETDYTFLAEQIKRAEATEALEALLTQTEQIRLAQGRYALALVEPLTLSGDALAELGNVTAALDQYDHALHLSRANLGLHNPEQTSIVYRQADLYKKMGDRRRARQREEYALEVMIRSLGSTNLDLLPNMTRLANFYLEESNFLPARALFQRGLDALRASGLSNNRDAIPFLQGIAATYRIERFPSVYYFNSSRDADANFETDLRSISMSQEYITLNNFSAGERSLQQVIEIIQQDETSTPQALAGALTDLADWHLLFGRFREAHTLYQHVYTETVAQEDGAANPFAEPELLYFPRPRQLSQTPTDSKPDILRGTVAVGFEVLKSGRTRRLETLSYEPDKAMEHSLRRSLRLSVYRPIVNAEGPQIANQTFTYNYEYYGDARAQALRQALADNPDESSADGTDAPSDATPAPPENETEIGLENEAETAAETVAKDASQSG